MGESLRTSMSFQAPSVRWAPGVNGARSASHEAGHVLAGYLWLGALPTVCTIVPTPERNAGCDWGRTLDIPMPSRGRWGDIPAIAQPQLVNRLRLLVGGAAGTRALGRMPGIWWGDDRERAMEFAKWLEGLDVGRQRKRVRDTLGDVMSVFAEPTPLSILRALASALLAEKTIGRARMATIVGQVETGLTS